MNQHKTLAASLRIFAETGHITSANYRAALDHHVTTNNDAAALRRFMHGTNPVDTTRYLLDKDRIAALATYIEEAAQ
jgi:hypothetical protein